jgi:LuxR family maltose regulon positive regulatory protein
MGTKANLEQAAEKLQQLRQVNEAAHNTCQMVEIIVLQAIAFHRQGHLDEALRVLEQAVAMTISSAWFRPFVEAGQPMADLLTRLQSQGGTKQSETLPNIAQILAAFPEETKPAADGGSSPIESGTISPAPTALESLTQRERQVLKLLATELFPQEIAVELDISVTTVRSHTKHIYGKLAVHGRLEAVKRAEALGLLN